ncbi:hypothetical protein J4E81_008441 [Alternaria sp. BMP 2799]|nr:hypothetical protein J4E81_008441 [Alternaria sp. BMP 2799]
MTPTQSFFDAQTQQLNLRNDEQSWAQPVHVLVSQGEIESNDSSDWLTVGQYNHEVRPRFTPSSSEDATADVNQLSEGRESSWEVLSRELSTRESSGDVVVVQGVGRDEDDMGPFPSPPRADDLGPSSNRHKKNTKDKSAILKPKRTDQRCNTGDPCDRCIKALSEPRSYHDPCYRDKLDKITTARHGNNNFGQREVEFLKYNWHPDADVKTIDIKWSLPGGRSVDLPGIRLDCRRFVPLNNDSHYITWQVNDEVVTIELPPYSGEDTAVITASVQQFLRGGNKAVLDYLIQDVEGKGDTFGAVSLREAMRYADKNPNSTVDLALRIRSAAYCSQGWGTVSGSETLGIGEFDFNEKGQCGYSAYDRGQERPLPLSIDHQIDVALLKTIRIMQDHLVKKLAKMIFQKSGRKPWYEIFLTMYVLLSNLEYVHFGSLSFLRAQMKTKSEQSCAFLTREMVAEYNYSAENLLHHFRAILRAQYGFKVARKNLAEFVKAESLDDESAQYIQRVLETLDARSTYQKVSD